MDTHHRYARNDMIMEKKIKLPGFKEYLQAQYDAGYADGRAGAEEYSGRTFNGYYGFLDGKQKRSDCVCE